MENWGGIGKYRRNAEDKFLSQKNGDHIPVLYLPPPPVERGFGVEISACLNHPNFQKKMDFLLRGVKGFIGDEKSRILGSELVALNS